MTFAHAKQPCSECPWRKDQPVGQFRPERFIALASTFYDMAIPVFGCHKSKEHSGFACAGAILRCHHNLTLRMNAHSLGDVTDGDHELYEGYREMAVANGVPANHPSLKRVR